MSKPDERHFIDHPNGKCFWAITSTEGELMYSRTAPSRDKAYSESAHHYRLLDQGKHLTQKRDS